MSIEIIDILKPKNGLSFKLIEDVDIAVQGYSSLADAVSHFVTNEAIQQIISAALSGKQDTLSSAQLAACNSGITSELVAQITLNTTAIADKADENDLITATTSLQAQIDAIVAPVTQDAEVQNARIDSNGESHVTLKDRLDSDFAQKADAVIEEDEELTPLSTDNGVYDNTSQTIVVPATATQYLCDTYDISSINRTNRLKVVGTQPSTKYRLITITDSNDDIIYMTPYSAAESELEITISIPNNAYRLYVNRKSTQEREITNYAVVTDIRDYLLSESEKNAITAEINSKVDKPDSSVKVDATASYTGLYNGNTKEIDTPASGVYKCELYTVDDYDKMTITGIQPSANYHLYTIYDENGNLVGSSAAEGTAQGEITKTVIMPNGAHTMYVNRMVSIPEAVYEDVPIDNLDVLYKKQLQVNKLTGGIKVFDGDYEFIWKLNGANNIMNFASATYKGNTLFVTDTDWIGPYDILAVNNQDGDRMDESKGITSSNTTGGNHDIHNETTSGTTGRTVMYKVYIDGKEYIDNESKHCTTVELRWINRIQAGNTAKLDGTGRECLEEHGYVRFLGNGLLEVGVTFKPLEDIIMNWYSGLQFAGSSFAPNMYVPEYTNQIITTSQINELKNTDKVSYLVAYGNDINLEMYMNRDYGIGKNELEYYLSGGTNKAYFITFGRETSPKPTLAANGLYSWQGHYRFFKALHN